MNKTGAILFLLGLFLAVGTAGASDIGNIGFMQSIIQLVISLVLMLAGNLILYIKHKEQ